MTGNEIRIIAGILFVIVLGALIWRRGSKTPSYIVCIERRREGVHPRCTPFYSIALNQQPGFEQCKRSL